MYRGNFRILIFIDLLATALGGSIILMLILSVNKSRSASPAGKVRDFLYYRVYSSDTAAQFKILIKNGSDNWIESATPGTSATGPFLIDKAADTSIFMWGPVNEYNNSGVLLQSNVYNAYSPLRKSGEWIFGVLYYNNQHASVENEVVLSQEVEVVHELHFPDNDSIVKYIKRVSLGNYSHITYSQN